MLIGRRGFIAGVVSALVAAPSIVRAASLMPIRGPSLATWHVRLITAYEFIRDMDISRLDVLYGPICKPEWEPLEGQQASWRKASEEELRAVVSRNGGADLDRAKRISRWNPGQQFKMDFYSDNFLDNGYTSWAQRYGEKKAQQWAYDDIQISDIMRRRQG